jgi:protein ImuB
MFTAIYIPDFPVEAIVRARPELRDHAVLIIEGVPPLAYVVALNDRARELGLHLGMTRMQAEAFAASLKGNKIRNGAPRPGPRQLSWRGEGPPSFGERGGVPPNGTNPPKEQDEGDPRFKLVRDSIHMHNAQGVPWLSKQKRKPDLRNARLALCQRSPQQEIAAHAALLDAAYAFSPRVEDTAADTIVLDIDGLQRLFGPAPKLARDIARRVSELGLEAQVAIAANPDNAIHAARGFAGVTVIPTGREAERLGSLPLDTLFATELCRHPGFSQKKPQEREFAKRLARIHETLDRWGIRNFRALAALPPVSLSERLGAEGVRLQKLANGETRRELLLIEAALEFQEAIELEHPVELIEPLTFLLGRLLEQLCARLTARALSTNELRLRLQLEHCAGDEMAVEIDELRAAKKLIERRIALPVAMNDPRLFLKLLHLELSGNPPGAPVIKMWLTAEPSRPRVAQAGLFVPLSPEPEKLELTLARIQRVLGATSLGNDAALRAGSPEILDTHQPDAFRMCRFQPKTPDAQPRKTPKAATMTTPTNDPRTTTPATTNDDRPSTPLATTAPATPLPTTALRILRPAPAATVSLRDARPVRLACEAVGASSSLDNILWAAGPWRTSGNWWVFAEDDDACAKSRTEATPLAWHREQWDVAVSLTRLNAEHQRETHVALYRLSHDLLSHEWLVEGSYD